MAQILEDWLNGEVKELSKLPVGDLSNTFFFRDPLRPNFIDWEHFYSPADGTIIYQKVVQPDEAVVEIKGIDYTLKDVMGNDEYDKPSLVIGIFMSFYDVHINRIPYGGILTYKHLEPIESTNKPMLAVEKDILNKVINPFKKQLDLCAQNERFSLIRWGSQVDLVLPLDDRFNFETLLDDSMHVNAGLDKLVKINYQDNDIQTTYRRNS